MPTRLRFSIEIPTPVIAIAGVFAVVPTLAAASGSEPLPRWPVLPLSRADLLKHFTHLRGDEKQWWTVATSALCHEDAKHRDGNIVGLLSAGWKPAQELGGLALAFTFFGGHIAAVLNSEGRRTQMRNWLTVSSGGLLGEQLASSFARVWDSAAPPRSLGGSAGIFALLGVDLCLAAEDLWRLLEQWESVDPEQALGRLAWLGINISQTVLRVHAERQSIVAGASVSVAHTGHLTGFLWGVGVFIALRWARRLRRLRVRQGYGAGPRGRRLGGR